MNQHTPRTVLYRDFAGTLDMIARLTPDVVAKRNSVPAPSDAKKTTLPALTTALVAGILLHHNPETHLEVVKGATRHSTRPNTDRMVSCFRDSISLDSTSTISCSASSCWQPQPNPKRREK